jgi:hypothetical protein
MSIIRADRSLGLLLASPTNQLWRGCCKAHSATAQGAHPKLPAVVKQRLRDQHRTLNPVALLAEIRSTHGAIRVTFSDEAIRRGQFCTPNNIVQNLKTPR